MWVRGAGAVAYSTAPARNRRDYQTAWIAVLDDGNLGYTMSHVLASWIE